LWNPPEEEYDDYDYEEEQPQQQEKPHEAQPARQPQPEARSTEQPAPRRERTQTSYSHSSDGKVVNLNSHQLQVVIFKPEHFGEETCAVADELIHTNTVVLNLEDTQKDVARRIIDFLSGVAYANGGKIKRVATNTFIITPYNVNLTGEDSAEETDTEGGTYY
ncbi:MAG: cell division protein SepF, partial [Oscillospiraceae bacterium]|nr:cell division protein SepF [Oscillospiraceae bacterium]